jgi:hypothetical protein
LHLDAAAGKLTLVQGRRIELCGVSVEVETDHAEFAAYLGGQFAASATDAPPDVAVRVRWTDGPRPALVPDAVFPGWPAETRVDRHVWLGPGTVLCLRQDDAPQIAVASRPGPPRRLELRFLLARRGRLAGGRRRLLRWRRLPALRRGRLSTLTTAVYYPVWWHLEARGLAHPLHAAAVALDGRALLFGGLPGCGKSTLATSFPGAPGAELLSDNVVLHDGAEVHGCFEPILLDAATRGWLAERVPLTPIGRRHQYARDAYHLPHRTGGVPLAAAVVVARGRATRLTRLASGECARLLLAANEAARRCALPRARGAPGSRSAALAAVEQRIVDLDRLLAGVPCYWLEAREGAPAEAVARCAPTRRGGAGGGELSEPIRSKTEMQEFYDDPKVVETYLERKRQPLGAVLHERQVAF